MPFGALNAAFANAPVAELVDALDSKSGLSINPQKIMTS
jgi:hypothetical protein